MPGPGRAVSRGTDRPHLPGCAKAGPGRAVREATRGRPGPTPRARAGVGLERGPPGCAKRQVWYFFTEIRGVDALNLAYVALFAHQVIRSPRTQSEHRLSR